MSDPKGKLRVGVDIGGTLTDRILTDHDADQQAIVAHITPIPAAGFENR